LLRNTLSGSDALAPRDPQSLPACPGSTPHQ